MLREGQSKMMENLANPMAAMPGYEAMKAQQQAFLKAMTGGWTGGSTPEPEKEDSGKTEDLDDIKKQLAELQEKLSKMGQ